MTGWSTRPSAAASPAPSTASSRSSRPGCDTPGTAGGRLTPPPPASPDTPPTSRGRVLDTPPPASPGTRRLPTPRSRLPRGPREARWLRGVSQGDSGRRGRVSVVFERPQERPLGLPHLLEQAVDLLQRARSRSQRIQRQRVPCGPAIPSQQRLDDQLVDRHMCSVQRRQLLRQTPEVAGLHAVAIDKAGNFHAPAEGQILDQSTVFYVSVDDFRAIQHDGFDDVGGVFAATFSRHRLLSRCPFLGHPAVLLLPLGPVVSIEAGLAQIAVAAVSPDQLRAFAK